MHEIKHAVDQLTADFKTFKRGLDSKAQKAELIPTRPAVGMNFEKNTSQSHFKEHLRQGTPLSTKSLTTTEGGRGGFFIPQIIHDRILDHVNTVSPLRQLARTLTISSSAVDVLLNKKDPDVGWVAEAGDRDETGTTEIAKVKISVHEMYAKPRATQKLLDDAAVHVENWLVQKVAEKMGQMETTAFINGDGDNKPKGFLTYDAVTHDALEWGKLEKVQTGADGAFHADNGADILIDAMQAMKSIYLKDSAWILSRSALAAVRKLKDKTTGQYLWQPGLGASPSSLLGYPVVVCDEMPALASGTASKAIVFANMKEAYQIVDRSGINILRDPYTAKPHVEFYVTKRVGGDVVNFEAIKVISFETIA